jgi:hypothetical protein
MLAPEPPLATVACRTFRGSQRRGLVLLVLWVLPVTSSLALLGLPLPLAMVALLLAILCGLGWLAGESRYTLTQDGIERTHRRFLGGATVREFTPFAALRSWRHDHELSRGLVEYEYFEFDRARGARWVVTNRQDAVGFAQFRAAWLARIALPQAQTEAVPAAVAGASPSPPPPPPPSPLPPPPSPPLAARRRRGRYQGLAGKVLALAAVLAACLLTVLGLLGHLDFGHWVRLALVVLPGTGYLCLRAFRRPRDPAAAEPAPGP